MKGRFLGLPVAKDGIKFIIPLFIASIICYKLGLICVGSIFLLLAIFVIYFFRDPERNAPGVKNDVISPADGRIVEIVEVKGDPIYIDDAVRVSIFLNIFNVHVNRSPISGEIVKILYNKGKFLNAANEKASLDNEQNALLIRTDNGKKVLVKQIAGLIARRIVCWMKEGESLLAGERFGLIRFGSRADLFLPKGSKINVKIGDKVKGGVDIIGKISE